jgi:hypothetical protein
MVAMSLSEGDGETSSTCTSSMGFWLTDRSVSMATVILVLHLMNNQRGIVALLIFREHGAPDSVV